MLQSHRRQRAPAHPEADAHGRRRTNCRLVSGPRLLYGRDEPTRGAAMTPAGFTPEELGYLRDQPLGRLATVDEQHAPQVVPVGFFVDEQTGDVSIGGIALGSTRKFRNVEATGR